MKSTLNAITKKIKKLIKTHWTTNLQKRIHNLKLNNDPKSWRTLKKEMSFPEKGISYLDFKINISTAKTDRDTLKLFAEQFESVFATKIELKDENLEREIGSFFILNIPDYSPFKSVGNHK